MYFQQHRRIGAKEQTHRNRATSSRTLASHLLAVRHA
jgi:hypothetical protein